MLGWSHARPKGLRKKRPTRTMVDGVDERRVRPASAQRLSTELTDLAPTAEFPTQR